VLAIDRRARCTLQLGQLAGTLLRVGESGFASVDGTEEQSAELAARHAAGWGGFLGHLAEHVSNVDASA
jgi:hypothetical protein